jgi:hypothetical protein
MKQKPSQSSGMNVRSLSIRWSSSSRSLTDLRTVRRTIAWIRDEFAAAAKRQHKPGTARLILLDPDRFASAPALPSLAEFAAAPGHGGLLRSRANRGL